MLKLEICMQIIIDSLNYSEYVRCSSVNGLNKISLHNVYFSSIVRFLFNTTQHNRYTVLPVRKFKL